MTNSTNKTTTTNTANPTNDYINHYFSGSPIIYVYSFGEHTDPTSGKTLHFFNGNVKVGKKDGKNYESVQGTLSPVAYDNLKSLIPLVNAGTHTIGVSVKSPRFEGTTAFLAQANQGTDPKDIITLADGSKKVLVSSARLRLNTIDSYKLFDKEQKAADNTESAQASAQPQAAAQVDAPRQGNPEGWPDAQAPAPTPVPNQ